MSTFKSKTRSSKTAREPPPSLFLHPSPSVSHASLPGISGTAAGSASNAPAPSTQPSQAPPSLNRTGSLLNPRSRAPVSRLQTADSARTADRTDALWAEMQVTLEEVELSASGGTHVFGPEHDQKLAELRAAQIALAQAWARSEADDPGESTVAEAEMPNLKGALGEIGISTAAVTGLSAAAGAAAARGTGESTDGARSTAGTGSARPGSSGGLGGVGGERLGAKLEEETERDILLARNRREANDKYFSRVEQGVKDVLAKLEDVAMAMKAVELESRDIWGDDGAPDSAKP
ncbi:hypothetical protein F4778DRAFT_447348 [Xylariomycetidae sp. FL2044]|nr:hypothetical protein F4778DRAFT_447348 [Xylariomycetidae sp. FL2044]